MLHRVKENEHRIIATDLDGTLIDTMDTIFKTLRNKHHYNISHLDQSTYEFESIDKEIKKSILKLFHDENVMSSIPPHDGAVEKIKQWTDKKYKVIILTSRPHDQKELTNTYCQRHFPSVECVILCGKNGKRKWFEKLRPDYWIDDHPIDVITTSQMGINTYLISNEKTLYNHHLASCPNIKCVDSIVNVDI